MQENIRAAMEERLELRIKYASALIEINELKGVVEDLQKRLAAATIPFN
jgi:hypothetical protein